MKTQNGSTGSPSQPSREKSRDLKFKAQNCGVIIVILAVICLGGQAMAQDAKNMEIKGGKVYLNLRDADLKTVLQIFAKATKKNIVASDDVGGKITVTFSGISPIEGLNAILTTRGLDWYEEAGTLFISTRKVMRTYYLEHARPSDIAETVKNILPKDSMVSVDDSYGVLVVQTGSDYLPRLEKLIKELDIFPTQVMIEVRMIELRHTEGGNVGVDAKYTRPSNANDVAETKGQAGRTTDTAAQGLYAQVISGDIEAYLSALKTAAKFNTIATPRITTLNNKEAHLLIGSKLGYKTLTITQTSTTQQIQFLEIGTSLKLTPYITKSGYIRMIVEPKISDGEVVNDLPQENTTESKNEVMVKDGQTFIIGGLMKDKDVQQDYGVPFIMDIPFLGSLFRKTVVSKEKQELLVFVTPKILTADNLSQMQAPIGDIQDKSDREKVNLIH